MCFFPRFAGAYNIASINFQEACDSLELKLEGYFSTMSTTKIIVVAESLGAENCWKDLKGDTQRIAVIKSLRNFIDVEVDEENFTHYDKLSMLEKLELMIIELNGTRSDVKTEDLDRRHEAERSKLEARHETRHDESSEIMPKESKSILSTLAQEGSIIRRELKICGQIGEADQKDKLTFVGLAMQIREAHRRGHSDMEIVNAVIKAMSPSLPLRKYLEASICDITLPILKKFLRSHFHEKSATELYQELTSLTQNQDEDALSFVWRALALRSKVNAASDEEEDKFLKYSQGLVHGITMNTIETGLRDENVRSQIRPLLKSSVDLSDVELTTQLHSIMLSEQNRNNKIHNAAVAAAAVAAKGNLKKSANVNVKKVSFEEPPSEIMSVLNEVKEKLGNMDDLHRTVAELQAEIKQLKAKGHIEGNFRNQDRTRRLPVCNNCAEKKEQKCNHCRRCGGENHIAMYCRQRPGTENQRGLQK